jgi:hypothetical protein
LHGSRDLARLDGQFGGDALYDLDCYGVRHRVLMFLPDSTVAALRNTCGTCGGRVAEKASKLVKAC